MDNTQGNREEKGGMFQTLKARNVMALVITLIILGATVFVAIQAILCEKKNGLEFVAQTLLPLWGTWIGTILAFYFSRENFEAATKSYENMIQKMKPEDKIAGVTVKEAMLPVSKITYLNHSESLGKTIKEILKDEKFRDYNRFAVFNNDNSLKYIVHRNIFFRFLAEVSMGTIEVEKNTDDITLKDMEEFASDAVKVLLYKGFTFVPLNATLLDAKKAMDAVPECQDVFVTQNGKHNEPVLGLITNNRILEYAKV